MRAPSTVAALAATAFAIAFSASAQQAPLFPEPLHLTRSVADPISETTREVDEYYAGNRVVVISGDRTTITDYDEQVIIEIDRAARTFSRTRFDVMAKTLEDLAPAGRTAEAFSVEEPRVRQKPSKGVAGRTTDGWIVELPAERLDGLTRIEVSVDPSIRLSDAAVEVLTGARFPNRGGAVADAVRDVSRRTRTMSMEATGSERSHALPVEQIVTWEIDGEEIRLVSRVERIGKDLPPAELTAIPDGAEEIEAHLVKMQRMLNELDSLPGVEASRK